MNSKTRQVIMVLIGAYLAYTGVTLTMSAWQGRPEHYVFMICCGVVFTIFGIFAIVMAVKNIIYQMKNPDLDKIEEDKESEE